MAQLFVDSIQRWKLRWHVQRVEVLLMEDSWEKWIASLETSGDNCNEQSHINSLDQETNLNGIIALESRNLSFQNVHHHYQSSTMPYNNNNVNNFPTTMGSSSLSYEEPSIDERHCKMVKSSSNSSNSIISQDAAFANSNSHIPYASTSTPSSSTFILSFENSTVEPAALQNRPKSNNHYYSPNKHFGGDAICSSLLSSEATVLSSEHVTKPAKAKQGAKKCRSSSETQDHIMAERKRRQELSERFIALSATIPGLKKTDKAYILREAITYMKQLQERVKELEENQNKRKRVDSKIFIIKKSKVCSREEVMTSCETNSYTSTTSLPQVEARVLEKEVLIGIHCQKQKDIVLKIMAMLQNFHLSLTSSSVLPFGTSTLKVTIVAQMGDKYCMTVNDVVKSLRQDLLKSHDIQMPYS
ncbi:hypothetical protein VNO78_26213 [Psophocarpus tetragonolobus]|uniref:BHLH domain-containing protein n=1 Tax=Psophocarpus tetragonolobus TaxID=3891 RepID=A0AAN9RZ48_PSOTE